MVYERFRAWKPARVQEDSIGPRTCSAACDIRLVYTSNDSIRVKDDSTILLVVGRLVNRVFMLHGVLFHHATRSQSGYAMSFF